jgi:hypothetical protein
MRLCAAVTAATLFLIVFSADTAHSAEVELRAFVGTWQENPAKSHHVISSALTYTFAEEADGFVTIVRGGIQLRDRVRFDGKDYPTPGMVGRTVSWTKMDGMTYETTIKQDGALLARGKWAVSDGGKRLTQETVPARADGQNDTNIIEYVRESGESKSLIGTWKPISSRSLVPDRFAVTLTESGELNVFYAKNQSSYMMRPDGKEYPLTNAPPGMTSSAEAIGQRTLRRTMFRQHTRLSDVVITVSADGKTLTATVQMRGSSDEPSVTVYEKQD